MDRIRRSGLAKFAVVAVTALVALLAGLSVLASDGYRARADQNISIGGTSLHFWGGDTGLDHVEGDAYVTGKRHIGGTGYSGADQFNVVVAGQVVTGYGYESVQGVANHDLYLSPSNVWAHFTGDYDANTGTYTILIDTSQATSYASWTTTHHPGYGCQKVIVPGLYIPLTGKGCVVKTSTNDPVITTGNPLYNFTGIQYSIYKGNDLMDVVTLNASGTSNSSKNLLTGSYTVRETRNENTGYVTNPNAFGVEVNVNQTTNWATTDAPIFGYARVTKKSSATGQVILRPGFEYDLFRSSDNQKVAHAVTDASGSALFKNAQGHPCPLALGDYYAKETAAPEPYFLDGDATYPVKLRQAGSNGDIQGGYHDGDTSGSRSNTVGFDAWNKQWGYVKVIKKNVATGATITNGEYRFNLYRAGDRSHVLATATTANGEALFVDGSGRPAKLVTTNSQDGSEGRYDICETGVTEPFYVTGEKTSIVISANGQRGATRTVISAPDSTGTVFKDGQPAEGSYTQAGEHVYGDQNPATQGDWDNDNTTPVEMGNDQYAFINVIKKNMELGKEGATVNQGGFKFALYYTEADAVGETNPVETIETDGTGTMPFTTRLPVKGTARADLGRPGVDAKRIHITSEASSRNDGVYYVRESAAAVPYNKSNLIYRFTFEPADGAAGTNGQVKATIDVRVDRAGRNTAHTGYDTTWRPYWNVPNQGNVTGVHGDARLSGQGVKNVADTTAEDAPQYGRATILVRDGKDGCVQRGAEYQVYSLQEVTYTSQRIGTTAPTAGYDLVGDEDQPFGYSKNRDEDVNTMSWPLPNVQMRDVSKTTHLEVGGSQFDPATGAVTVSKPITFMRANGSTYDTIVTDEHGKATTGWLPIGSSGSASYALVQVKTANGHVINGDPIEFTLTYDSALQDAEGIIETKVTSNRRDDQKRDLQPNKTEFYKIAKATRDHPEEESPIEGVTFGFWKEEDDIQSQVTPSSHDGTYAFDAVVIRTSDQSLRPTVHQRVVGSELYIEELDSDLMAVLILEDHRNDLRSEDPTVDDVVTGGSEGIVVTDNKRVTITKQHVSDTVPTGTYDVILIEKETGKWLEPGGLSKLTLEEGMRTHLRISRGALTGKPTVAVTESSPVDIRTSNVSYRPDLDAWVATNLKCGTEYEVEFDRKVVQVIHTTETGGRTWFGRFSYDETPWFHNGWLDQAALPTNDDKIILKAGMSVGDGDPAYDKFSTNAVRTQGNQMWLQDTEDARTYGNADIVDGNGDPLTGYAMVTGKDGLVTNERIGAGRYVVAEIKPPSDANAHQACLPDLHPHYFEVDDVTGYIRDTDDQDGRHDYNYREETHPDGIHVAATSQRLTFIDDVTKLLLSKREVAGGDELVGAELVLTASNNDVIDHWFSTETPQYFEGLTPGWYRLTECATPKNYDKAESIEFNLLPTSEVQHTIMLDTPIYVNAEIDKIQEIANPLGEQDRPNGDGKNHAEAQKNDNGLYSYSLDFRSKSNTWTDEFTVEDPLEPADKGYARLRSLVTPQVFQDYDGKMNVWYQTNKLPNDYRDLESAVPTPVKEVDPASDASQVESASDKDKDKEKDEDDKVTDKPVYTYVANATYDDNHENPWLTKDKAMVADEDRDWRITSFEGWKVWRKDVPTAVGTRLDVADLDLEEDEYVTGIRFEYGRVEVGFTSRVEEKEWVRENLKYEHDDSAKITGLSTQSFQSTERAADAAISRMSILTSRFTTDMSFLLQDDVARQRAQAKKDYEAKLISIDEYNAQIAATDTTTLPKFAEALQVPAAVDDAEDVERLDAYLETAKASLAAAFPLATTSESRGLLLLEAKQAVADVSSIASAETLANLKEKIDRYELEIERIPSDAGGSDIDAANTELMNAFMRVLDDIRLAGLSGRVPYAPAVFEMQLTDAYVPGVAMTNSAKVDAYRNGGNAKDDTPDEQHSLEGHDEDEVVQTLRKKDDIFISTKLTTPDGQKIVTSDGTEAIILTDLVEYHNLDPGRKYKLDGILHVRSYDSKAKKPIDGGTIKGSGSYTTFSPTQPDGTVEVKLVMPASETLWRPVVAYEELHMFNKKTGVASDTVIAEHEDITDEDQTIQVTLPAEEVVDTAPILQAGDKVALATIGSLAATIGLGTVAFTVRRCRR